MFSRCLEEAPQLATSVTAPVSRSMASPHLSDELLTAVLELVGGVAAPGRPAIEPSLQSERS
jgi:hypothetical protein